MGKSWDIYYCHVSRRNRYLSPGHWFFHTGQWVQCGSAHKTKDGKWQVHIDFAPSGKELPDKPPIFHTIEEAKRFVGEFFQKPIVDVKSTVLRRIMETEL